jgi:hypothetical protein
MAIAIEAVDGRKLCVISPRSRGMFVGDSFATKPNVPARKVAVVCKMRPGESLLLLGILLLTRDECGHCLHAYWCLCILGLHCLSTGLLGMDPPLAPGNGVCGRPGGPIAKEARPICPW